MDGNLSDFQSLLKNRQKLDSLAANYKQHFRKCTDQHVYFSTRALTS